MNKETEERGGGWCGGGDKTISCATPFGSSRYLDITSSKERRPCQSVMKLNSIYYSVVKAECPVFLPPSLIEVPYRRRLK